MQAAAAGRRLTFVREAVVVQVRAADVHLRRHLVRVVPNQIKTETRHLLPHLLALIGVSIGMGERVSSIGPLTVSGQWLARA